MGHETTGNTPLKTKLPLCFAAVTQLSRSQSGVTNMLHLLLGILFISLQCQLRGKDTQVDIRIDPKYE